MSDKKHRKNVQAEGEIEVTEGECRMAALLLAEEAPLAAEQTYPADEHTDRMANRLGYLIPRKNRGDLMGDILEDVAEYREAGMGKWAIRFYVAWQWALAVVLLALRQNVVSKLLSALIGRIGS